MYTYKYSHKTEANKSIYSTFCREERCWFYLLKLLLYTYMFANSVSSVLHSIDRDINVE